MAAASFTPLKTDPKLQGLLKEAKEHEAFIEGIKQRVAETADNLDNPVPLFQQLHQAAS